MKKRIAIFTLLLCLALLLTGCGPAAGMAPAPQPTADFAVIPAEEATAAPLETAPPEGGYVYVYLLARNFHFTLYLAPLAGVVLYAYFTLNSALVLDFNVKMGLLTAGTVKAFAEMGLGIALFRLWDRLREREWRLPGRLLLTLLLLFSLYRYFALTVNAAVGFDNFKRIIYIMLILLLAFLNGDWIDRLLNHGFSRFLGGLSMTMYVSHFTFTTLYFMLLTALQKRLPGSEFRDDGGRETLRAFHDALCAEYAAVLYGDVAFCHRMKEVWSYLILRFDGGEKHFKRIAKAKTKAELQNAAAAVFAELPLLPEARLEGGLSASLG